MYKIILKNGNETFTLHDLKSDTYILSQAGATIELNKTGELTLGILPEHPYYNYIQKMKSEIIIMRDNEHFRSFRCIDETKDMYNTKTITCEGELAYLLDSIQRYGEFHNISVEDYFAQIISQHNEWVDEDKQFIVGTVNVVDSNDSLYRYASYEDTWTYINDKLIDRLGGYICSRHVNGQRYIDYVTDYGNINSQTIEFGENIIDFSQKIDASGVATIIMPLGCKQNDADGQETERRLTIEDAIVGDAFYGKDYLIDEDAVKIFGKIAKPVYFDDVTLPNNLYSKGQEALNEQKTLGITIELNAIDLHLLNVDVEQISLGDSVRVVSKPHGVDTYMKVTKMEIDFLRPDNTKLVLGTTLGALSEQFNKSSNTTKEMITQVQTDIISTQKKISQFSSAIEQNIDSIKTSVSEITTIRSELEQIQRDFSTSITQTSEDITFNFISQVQSVENGIYSNSQLMQEYIRFKGALIELGKVGSAFTTELSNEELAFLQYGQKIAYINGNKMYIVQAEVKKILTLGDDITGKYDFIKKENGNLTFKWRAVI